jgi:hypothetical protein
MPHRASLAAALAGALAPVACGGSGSSANSVDAAAFDGASQSGSDATTTDSPGEASSARGIDSGGDALGAGDAGGAGCPPGGPSCAVAGVPCCAGSVCGPGLACRNGNCWEPPPANTGGACSSDSQCPGGLCVGGGEPNVADAATGTCTTACTSNAECIAGWTCSTSAGEGVCQCTSSGALCDGMDALCSGIVDEQPYADEFCDEGNGMACVAGACACLLTCAGTCVNPRSDANNCGGCGVTCSANTQLCADGVCTCLDGSSACAMTTLATGQDSPLSIATYGGNVYWTNAGEETGTANGSVMMISEDGGAPIAIAGNQDYPVALAVDATGVYWGTTGGALMRAPLDGGAPVTLATGSSQITSVVLDDTHVYWACGAIESAPKDAVDASATALVADAGARTIAVAGGALYWVALGKPTINGPLMMLQLDGGAPTTLAGSTGFALGAVDAANAYVIANLFAPGPAGPTLVAYPLDGGAPTPLLTDLGSPNEAIVSDGKEVYVTTGGTGSDVTIVKTTIACPALTTVVTGLTGSYYQPLAIDGDTLYFVASGSSTFGDNNGIVAKVSPR